MASKKDSAKMNIIINEEEAKPFFAKLLKLPPVMKSEDHIVLDHIVLDKASGRWVLKIEEWNEEETISEADLTELVDFIKECVAEVRNKLVEANQKMDRLIKERAEFWQEIEEKNKEIAKYVRNR